MNLTKNALINFTKRYLDYWQTQYHCLPKSQELHAIPSPCIIKTEQLEVYWQPVLMEPMRDLYIVEQVVGIVIRPEIHEFYGTQYAGDMNAEFNNIEVSLIQVWNEDDFERLSKNLISHLSMQKKLKRKPTLFIASTKDDTQIITVNNVTGEVVIEDLISGEIKPVSGSIELFLKELKCK